MSNAASSLLLLRSLLVPLIGMSFVSNLAILISPIFMMQVLDRVIPSGNVSTLFMLLLIALLAISTNAFVDYNRDRALGRCARWVDKTCMDAALGTSPTHRQTAIDHVIQLRDFFSSGLPTTALNVPWIPLFLVALLLIHPFFPLLVAGLILVLWLIKSAGEYITAVQMSSGFGFASQAQRTLSDISANIGVGGLGQVVENLCNRYVTVLAQQHQVEDRTANITTLATAFTGFVRMAAQLLALSLGAFLVVSNELTAGGMIGASIICAKAIAAAESALNGLPRIRSSWVGFKHLHQILSRPETRQTEVFGLSGSMRCENLTYPRSSGAEPRLNRISFVLEAGECLAIIGDSGSGSGKTTLLNATSGVDPAPIGTVFLDDSEIQTLGPATRRKMLGYLPQQATLLNGSVADNISGFANAPDDDQIISAAKTAGVHGLVSALPNAYETQVGGQSNLLSAGQKQRVALARVIYENPRYLFLDEPNSLLDAHGERQLCDTLANLKARGVTIVMVLHRSGIMGLADKVMLMDQGKVADYGPRSEVLGRVNAGQRKLVLPVTSAALQDLADWITAQFVRNTDQGFCQKAILAATEMFNATCLNGTNDIARKVTFTFRFQDSKTCNIRLVDSSATELESKLPKIQSLIKYPYVDMIDIEADEMALAVVMQLSDSFNAESTDKTSLLDAWLSSDTPPSGPTASH